MITFYMDNKYPNGTVAGRGDIVSTKGALYVVVDPAHDDGWLFFAAIERLLGYTRKVAAPDCQIAIPGLKAKQNAIEVLAGHRAHVLSPSQPVACTIGIRPIH